MSKIGIMGGTFNPIHTAHLILGESAYEQFGLDQILFMPSKTPPHKLQEDIISNEHRSSMVQLAIESNPHFEFSSLELNRTGITYTFDTLEELTKIHPENQYYFILGADSLFQIEQWKNPERIFQLTEIIAAGRYHLSPTKMEDQIAYLNLTYKAKIHLLQIPNMDISSNLLRKKLLNGQSIRYYVPEKVEYYITEHNLYRD
jgi:nicotinate-nucleotide adenylyltransferase